MARRHRRALLVLGLGLLVAGCRRHDPARELELSELSTYWIVDSPRQDENFVAPVVRFRLKNVSGETIGSIQARARFPAENQEEAWGSIQEQVCTWRHPLEPGHDALVTVRSAGRYHSAAPPEEILRSPGFKDPKVEVYVRIGASNWALLASADVERRIGAPDRLPLAEP